MVGMMEAEIDERMDDDSQYENNPSQYKHSTLFNSTRKDGREKPTVKISGSCVFEGF